jgi:hypothetical protein
MRDVRFDHYLAVSNEVKGISIIAFTEYELTSLEYNIGRTADQQLDILRAQSAREGMLTQNPFKVFHTTIPSSI